MHRTKMNYVRITQSIEDSALTSPISEFIRFISRLQRRWGIPQIIYGEFRQLWLYFPDSVCMLDELTAEYGFIAARLSSWRKLSFQACADQREPAAVTWKIDSAGMDQIIFNESGQTVSLLSQLCLSVSLEETDSSWELMELIRTLIPNRDWAALPRNSWIKQDEMLRTQKDTGLMYVYVKLQADSEMPFYQSLTGSQREALWFDYLISGHSALEFDYVIQTQIAPEQLWLWELAARSAMTKTGLTVINDTEHFILMDCRNTPRRLDFYHGSAAEKLLLKVIFPLAVRS